MTNLYPQNDYRNYLLHSAKGTKWKDHKYIDIINGRYIYPVTNVANKLKNGLKSANQTDGNSTSGKTADGHGRYIVPNGDYFEKQAVNNLARGTGAITTEAIKKEADYQRNEWIKKKEKQYKKKGSTVKKTLKKLANQYVDYKRSQSPITLYNNLKSRTSSKK